MNHVLHAYYLGGHGDNPVVLRSDADVDELLSAVGVEDPSCSVVALYLADRPLNTMGVADHELSVGVSVVRGVGAFAYFDQSGIFYSQGSPSGEDIVYFVFMGNGHRYPGDSQLPLDVVRQAVKEFMATGKRPTSVAWQPDPFRLPMPDESPYY